jgi:lysophospholipid acyltransferase (LPLAT)-like uncharacterized protein
LNRDEDFVGPVILYTWHQNTFLTLLLAMQVASCRRSIGLTNDRLASLLVTLPATFFGYRMFVFTLRNKENRVHQVSECFKHGNPMLMMADGGGPFFKLKPGLLKTAAASQAQLVPVAFRLTRGVELGKTRRHRWPAPFSTVDCLVGAPVDYSGGDGLLNCQRGLEELERELNSGRR